MSEVGNINVIIGGNAEHLQSSIKQAQDYLQIGFSKMQTFAASFGSKFSSSMKVVGLGVNVALGALAGSDVKVAKAFTGLSKLAANLKPVGDGFKNIQNVAVRGLSSIGQSVAELDFSIADLGNPLALAQLGMSILGKSGVFSFESIIKRIVSVINYFIDLYNNSLIVRAGIEGIKFAFTNIWETAKLLFNNLKHGFSTVGKIITAIWNGEFSSLGDIVKEGFKNISDNVVDHGTRLALRAGEAMKNAVNNRLNNISESDVKGFLSNFSSIGEKAGAALSNGIAKNLILAPAKIGTIASPTEIKSKGIERVAPEIDNSILKFYDEVQKKIGIAVESQKIWGDEIDLTAEKTNIWTSAINNLLQNGISASNPILTLFKEQLDNIRGSIQGIVIDLGPIMEEALTNFIENITDAIGQSTNIGEALHGSFLGIFDSIAGIMELLGKTALKAGFGIEAIKASFASFSGISGIVAGTALLAFSKIIKSSLASIPPKLAKGGLAYGATLAVVGDNPNASIDPEVIAPLSKLKNMLGESATSAKNLFLHSYINGNDLILATDRTRITRSVITGGN